MTPGPRFPHAPFEITPGVGIGPFRIGMTSAEIETICRQYGWKTGGGVLKDGLLVEFRDGRAIRITLSAEMVSLSIAGEELMDLSDEHVRYRLSSIVRHGDDWTEADGLTVFHWEASDHTVFAFMVYAPGHRDRLPGDS